MLIPVLFHAIQNHKKVIRHGVHANSCSADVALKIFPCFPKLLQSMEKQGKHGETMHGLPMNSILFPMLPTPGKGSLNQATNNLLSTFSD